jgi:hypothetical protein
MSEALFYRLTHIDMRGRKKFQTHGDMDAAVTGTETAVAQKVNMNHESRHETRKLIAQRHLR